MSVGGLGPWFCALYVNLESKAKKKTELRVHTYPILYERLSKEKWITIMVVGPFEKWVEGIAFYEMWARQTRGITRRIQKGLNLYATFQKKYKLHMWVTQVSKQTILDTIKEDDKKRTTLSFNRNRELLLGDVHRIQLQRKKK